MKGSGNHGDIPSARTGQKFPSSDQRSPPAAGEKELKLPIKGIILQKHAATCKADPPQRRNAATPTRWEAAVKLEEAILTALEYENRIRDIYLECVAETEDPAGKKIFRQLADDEQRHVEYLEHKLRQWRSTGRIEVENLESTVPAAGFLRREAAKVKARVEGDHRGLKQQMLSKALKAEIETSEYYRKLVGQLTADGRKMFARFLEIENNHIEAVQFELDHVGRTGYWFGFEEFDMEAG